MRKTAILMVVVSTLSGCGTATMTRLNVAPYETAEFTLLDKRPDEQRLSGEKIDATGLITMLGDNAIHPTPMQLTKTWLGKTLPAWLRNKSIELQDFTVQIFTPKVTLDERRFQTATATVSGDNEAAPLSRLFIHGIESIRSPKPVTVKITVNVDGQKYYGYDNRAFQGQVTEENIGSVVLGALDSLRRNMDKPESTELRNNPPKENPSTAQPATEQVRP